MTEIINEASVPVNWGKLLESQLKKWYGGGHHPRGIAEYISNSDDSYRRLKKFSDQNIIVEIHSRYGKKIDKLIIQDFAEGMSFEDLENKFFRYFESFSGRERGEKVTGQYIPTSGSCKCNQILRQTFCQYGGNESSVD